MDSTRSVSESLSVRRPTRDPQKRNRGSADQFEREFEEQAGDAAVEKHDAGARKRLQLEPVIRRKVPSEGDFHIDVVV
ncbi:MAG: hypothetical protein KDB80_11075 [Planctomycetes bacterium]|nr:hypothetical protein [Planctomycetota bacterium]